MPLPPAAGDRFRMASMTRPEVDEALGRARVVVIPTGSCEQHGPALALETDTVRAEALAVKLADRLAPDLLVAPSVPLGVSEHHMGFAGTLTLSPATFVQVIFEMIESLYRHGWRRVFILNGHGGNDAALGVLSTRVMRELPDMLLAWSGISPLVADVSSERAKSTLRGHSCEIETSQTMYLSPASVRSEHLRPGTSDRSQLQGRAALSRSNRAIHMALPYDQVTPTGALGDGTAASVELGEVLIETATERLAAFLTRFAAETIV